MDLTTYRSPGDFDPITALTSVALVIVVSALLAWFIEPHVIEPDAALHHRVDVGEPSIAPPRGRQHRGERDA